METGKGIVGRWGLVLTVAVGLWVGCSPRTEIGAAEPEGEAGASALGNASGSGGAADVSDAGGQGGAPSTPATANRCFEPMTADDLAPRLGPNNQVFPSVRKSGETLLNYANNPVFAPPNWQLEAQFPASDRSDDTGIQLPNELSAISENLGEVHVTRPECQGLSAAGRTLRVYAWWKLGGAIGRTPTEGITLGTTDGESFADSTIASLVGGSEQTRPLNTLDPIVLEHTFSATDQTDAGDVVLKLWLLETFAFPSTLYINRVEWE
jgi:hypothetical protein